jgi:catechol 2,3-dioxygenase-like lactoylglutathione lyase family enzyme
MLTFSIIENNRKRETRQMSTNSIWHVGITVSDMDRSINFYTKCFDMKLRHRQIQDNEYSRKLVGYPDGNFETAQLIFAEAQAQPSGHVLELVCYSRPKDEQLKTRNAQPGAMHIAFHSSDIFESIDKLVNLGATLTSEPQAVTAGINTGGYAVYLRDPDNVPLELVQPPEVSVVKPTQNAVDGQ